MEVTLQGKLIFLKVLAFIARFITRPQIYPSEHIFDLETFRLLSKNGTSKIKIVFYIEDIKYTYSVNIEIGIVVKEELFYINADKNKSYLFTKRINKNGKVIFTAGELKTMLVDATKIVDFKTSESCFVNVPNLNNIHFQRIINYWSKTEDDIETKFERRKSFNTKEISIFYEKNKEYFSIAKKIMKDFGFSMSDIKIQVHQRKEYTDYILYSVYSGKNNETFPILFLNESSGTKHVLKLLSRVIPVLNFGGIIILDELDVTLHPHLVPKFVDLFVDKTINKKNAQLIFASHSIEIMNNLDKNQIYFVEKNEDNESGIFCLNDFKGVRRFENFAAKYNAGAYGAIPEID